MSARVLLRLAADRSGSIALEFALVGTLMALMLFGVVEVGLVEATDAMLEAAARQASRYGATGDSDPLAGPVSLQRRQDRIRAIVASTTNGLVDQTRLTIEVKAYASFDAIGKPEPLDGKAPGGFVDVNGNGKWDADMGRSDAGGPNDVVVYTLTYPQPIVVPIVAAALGVPAIVHRARVVVRNEPF